MNPDPVGPEPRFRALATSAPVGIYELDPRGECVFVNEHWCSIAGVPTEAGLGLTVAKAILDAHGATIEVTSEPGEGSTFRVELPRRAAAVAGADEPEQPSGRQPTGRRLAI